MQKEEIKKIEQNKRNDYYKDIENEYYKTNNGTNKGAVPYAELYSVLIKNDKIDVASVDELNSNKDLFLVTKTFPEQDLLKPLVLNWNYYPFTNKAKIIQQLKDGIFNDVSNTDFFVYDANNKPPFVSALFISNVLGVFNSFKAVDLFNKNYTASEDAKNFDFIALKNDAYNNAIKKITKLADFVKIIADLEPYYKIDGFSYKHFSDSVFTKSQFNTKTTSLHDLATGGDIFKQLVAIIKNVQNWNTEWLMDHQINELAIYNLHNIEIFKNFNWENDFNTIKDKANAIVEASIEAYINRVCKMANNTFAVLTSSLRFISYYRTVLEKMIDSFENNTKSKINEVRNLQQLYEITNSHRMISKIVSTYLFNVAEVVSSIDDFDYDAVASNNQLSEEQLIKGQILSNDIILNETLSSLNILDTLNNKIEFNIINKNEFNEITFKLLTEKNTNDNDGYSRYYREYDDFYSSVMLANDRMNAVLKKENFLQFYNNTDFTAFTCTEQTFNDIKNKVILKQEEKNTENDNSNSDVSNTSNNTNPFIWYDVWQANNKSQKNFSFDDDAFLHYIGNNQQQRDFCYKIDLENEETIKKLLKINHEYFNLYRAYVLSYLKNGLGLNNAIRNEKVLTKKDQKSQKPLYEDNFSQTVTRFKR